VENPLVLEDAAERVPQATKQPHGVRRPAWFWPERQQPWERVVLVGLTVPAAVVYGWNVHRMHLHLYYGAAVKSMSGSLTAFLYGAYDPAATLTMDKLPGVFWVQALSARLFGFHAWSVLLPQVLASLLAVLLLYRVVRDWMGPAAGILAAAAYASTPIVAALARTQVPDVLLVLLMILAASAWQRAMVTGALKPLLLCGVWLGLAFQAKMVHGWSAWVPFAVVYLVVASMPLRRRVAHLAAAASLTLAVSLAWVAAMLAVPASARPYVDGSMDNSPLSMVFGYNALNRYGIDNGGAGALGVGGPLGRRGESPWLYMVGDGVAPQVGWLYPIALLGLVCGLLRSGRRHDDDASGAETAQQVRMRRAGYAMWGLWLLTQSVAFAASLKSHTFYLLSVAAPVAALAGAGLVVLWSAYRRGGWQAWVLPAGLVATLVWAILLGRHFPTFYPWLPGAVAVTGALAVTVLVAAKLPAAKPSAVELSAVEPSAATGPAGPTASGRLAVAGAVLGLAAILLAPSAWTLSVADNLSVVDAHRPAAGPASRETGTVLQGRLPRVLPASEVDRLIAFLHGNAPQKFTVAVQWAPQAGPFILAGMTPLPVGGFTAQVPNVTPQLLADLVARGELRYAIVDGPAAKGMVTPDYPDYATWVRQHCRPVPGYDTTLYTLHDCAGA
jgi:4-amino-4-deoxy-L-arabinose transferase-like glycosyltransferase